MAIRKEALPKASWGTDAPDAIGLARELGELPLDLRRKGIGAIPEAEGGGLRLADGTADDAAIRFERPDRALERLDAGQDIRIVGLALQHRRETILVPEESRIHALADLRSARLGYIETGHPSDEIGRREAHGRLGQALADAGVAKEAIEWAALRAVAGQAGTIAAGRLLLRALLRGEADAVHAGGAFPAQTLRLLGLRELEAYEAFAPVSSVLTVSGEWLRRRPDDVARIVAHAAAAASWASDNREEANRLAARQLGLPEDAVEAIYSARLHREYGFAITDEKWGLLARQKEVLEAAGALKRDFNLAQAADLTVVPAALALIADGGIEPPQGEAVTAYAASDLPRAFFTDRPPARVLAGDEEALEAARAFAAEIAPGASERDRKRRLPLREMQRLAELGLLGLVVPKAYGGPDVRTRTLVEIFKTISRADGAIGQIPQNHHFFVKTIELVASEEQKRFFFHEVLKGAQFGNALAERGGGPGPRKVGTTLRRAGEDAFALNGSKYYATGALYAHWIPVTALDEEGRRMTAFVPRHAPGVTVLDDWSGIGQRTTASGGVVLRDVRVPERHVLPHWRIFEGPQYFTAFGQIMHAAVDLGIAQAALADAAHYVREFARPPYGSGWERASEEPDLIRRFGELGIRLQAAEALLDRAADAIDDARADLDEETAGRAALTVDSAKWLATETSLEIANALFEVAGTSSMDRKHNYDRHWRNIRIHTLHDPARLKLHHVGKWFLNGVYHTYQI
ncbi:SfnB family sulfur acquisition oxidoreductase [Cohnella sp. REN36]|uniref:SfnB family sulfur acquisition oxidoreductase n=1 Tax=Cohnella sp. REN36 TaxID=2887347 RepID=UPI001D1421BD|nr:SfnB family sulfur acquisition oxidoreductase [Cohnella sp. REN36]MCC3371475.1 SfnB family sulfur acquisition oxidoreductase [Cohnella sp. REN36]